MKSKLEIAAQWCLDAHEDQVDKAGVPYFYHPFYVSSMGTTEEERIVGLLHDVLEDSEVINPIDILNEFGQEIFDAVVAITRGRNETYGEFIERCSQNKIARNVKLYDIEHNLKFRGFKISDSLKERYLKAEQYILNNMNLEL